MSDSDSGTTLGCLFLVAVVGFALYGAFVGISKLNHAETPHVTKLADHSVSLWRGSQQDSVLSGSDRQVTFSLRTSWIEGPENKGILRYIVEIFPTVSTSPVTDSYFLNAVSRCKMSIQLTDKQGFKLAKLPLTFTGSQDSNHNTVQLSDNDSIVMSREEYESMGETSGIQAWDPIWNCN